MTYRYRMHGLTVHSDLPLPAIERAGPESPPDLVIERGQSRTIPDEPPPGRIISEAIDADGSRFCTTAMDGDRAVLRYHRQCDFEYSPDVSAVTWRLHPGRPEEAAGVMAAGGMMSVALILQGRLILHASAVEAEGRALAFVGRSGMGKSTLATLLCGQGCRLLSDDLLRIDDGACYSGSTETRLRPSAEPLARSAPPGRSRRTVDDRMALELASSLHDSLPLAAVVVPRIDRDGQQVVAERISPLRATLELSRFPRVLGWQDPDSSRRQFELLSEMAVTVPVWRCRIPWGPPFPPDLPQQILAAVGM